MNGECVVHLFGRFRIVSETGENLTPRGVKAQGLLALLATSPRFERGRTWLQDKLWSTREQPQAAASLRQALSEIRRSFGENADLISADRGAVTLNPERLRVSEAADGEFLEGLDVRDPEFETWLTSQRVVQGNGTAPPRLNIDPDHSLATARHEPPCVVLNVSGAQNPDLAWTENLLVDFIARSLQETTSANVIVERSAPSGIRVNLQIFPMRDHEHAIRITVGDIATGARVWSHLTRISGAQKLPSENPALVRLINVVVDVVGDSLGQNEKALRLLETPNSLCRAALQKMFSMNEALVAEADRDLAKAYEMDPKAIYLGWRAQLKVIQYAERHALDHYALKSEALSLARTAIEAEPQNSMVLSTAANSYLFINHEVNTSLELAKRSVQLNSTNPLAWWSLSASKLYAGDAKASYQMASLARDVTSFSPFGFWWDLQRAAAALVGGRLKEALNTFELTHNARPDFRPPLRYLTALYAHHGEEEKAINAAQKLARLESDFSIDRILTDRDYPASLLWRETGLEMDRLAQLA